MNTKQKTEISRHDRYAPCWAAALVILTSTGIATNWIDLGNFWKGYVLDIVGPAWAYILFRGLYTKETENIWTRFFTPEITLILLFIICVGIEIAQYMGLYKATFDIMDFLAYVSITLPIFLIDKLQHR